MKKGLLSLLFIGLLSTGVLAADGDIDKVEVRPDVTKERPYSITFYPGRKLCKVVHHNIDASGNVIDKVKADFIENVADDPTTPKDESTTAYTALMANINNNNNFMLSIKNRVIANRAK